MKRIAQVLMCLAVFGLADVYAEEINKPVTPDQQHRIDAAKQIVAEKLKQTKIVDFHNVHMWVNDGSVCGEVNYLNRKGKPSGFKVFTVAYGKTLNDYSVYIEGVSGIDKELVDLLCKE